MTASVGYNEWWNSLLFTEEGQHETKELSPPTDMSYPTWLSPHEVGKNKFLSSTAFNVTTTENRGFISSYKYI